MIDFHTIGFSHFAFPQVEVQYAYDRASHPTPRVRGSNRDSQCG
jgi:hypothetical protein